MHEYSLAKDIVRRALREVQGRERVVSFGIVIGEEEHIAPDALSLGVASVSFNTAAEGATVHLRRIPGAGVLLESVEMQESGTCA